MIANLIQYACLHFNIFIDNLKAHIYSRLLKLNDAVFYLQKRLFSYQIERQSSIVMIVVKIVLYVFGIYQGCAVWILLILIITRVTSYVYCGK